jgi:hypothetical protein
VFEDFADELSAVSTMDSPVAKADRILQKLKDLREWAQAAIATAQDAQEKAANRGRVQAPAYQVGDKVWLSLENIATDRPSKKLDAKYAEYTVTEVVSSHSYRLDTPPGIHNVFHTRLLKPATSRPLPGQVIHEPQPPALMIDDDGEGIYEIDGILDQKKARGRREQYLVKWTGYAKPTWTPASALEHTDALQDWKRRKHAVGRRGVL